MSITSTPAIREWGESVAATLDGPCAGALSFEGTTWTHHLPGACVGHLSAAPWAEEPVRRDDHRGLARVSRAGHTAVATGENLTSP